jgi:uncharacterized protein (TIGR02231 family)
MLAEQAASIASSIPTSVPTSIPTAIAAVTCYSQQARIQRRGQIDLVGSETALLIENLPLSLVPESLRVAGRGSQPVRILGVRSEHHYGTTASEPQLAQLQAQFDEAEAHQRSLHDRLKACQLQHQVLDRLGDRLHTNLSQALVRQTLSLDDAGRLLDFLGERHNQGSSTVADLEQEKKSIDRQIDALNHQIAQLRNPRPTESRYVLVLIEPSGAGAFELELTYMVHQATWMPLYDLDVQSREGTLTLDYQAQVEQTTGEDWLGVALTLSTAKPGLGSLPPKLDPWYLGVRESLPMIMAAAAPMAMERARMVKSSPEPEFDDGDIMSGGGLEEMSDVEIVTATVEQIGGVVSFQVGGGSNIPADGNPHKVTLHRDRHPAEWQYRVMAKQVSFAYLQAVVRNPEDGVTMLPGQANLFRDGAFVGTSHLAHIAPGQIFKVDLGIDETVQVERDLIDRQANKKFISGLRQITYSYRIKLTNLQPQRLQLQVIEQLPVSRHERVKVKLLQSLPRLEVGELGLLEWMILLQPQQTQEVSYEFSIEHPPEWKITGLAD